LIAAGITQINLLITHNIATLQPGAPSWLYYSDRLYQLPLGMIGIALGIALLPSLSRSLRADRTDEAMMTLNRATEIAAFLTLPAACALFIMPEFLISTLFERGRFTPEDSLESAKALRMFALGLPAFVLIKVLTPTFFAREDTRTPMIFAAISAFINVACGYALFFTIGFYGLALATTLAAWGNVLCLAVTQKRRGHFIVDSQLLVSLPKMMVAAGIMSMSLIWLLARTLPHMRGEILWDYAVMLALCGCGTAVYIAVSLVLRIFKPADLKQAFRK